MDRILHSSWVGDVAWARGADDRKIEPHGWVEAWLPPAMRIVAVGESEELGSWDPLRGVELVCRELPRWFFPETLAVAQGTPYKLVVLQGDELVAWEEGDNRVWEGFVPQGVFRGAPRIDLRMAGMVVPVFSIRGAGCEGIGDFTALGDFAVWAAKAGMKVVQTLPINDTTINRTWADSYPYNSVSVFALNPLYIRVSEVDPSVDLSDLERCDTVDYERVAAAKWQVLRAAYEQQGEATLGSDDFLDFFRHNETWLPAYAVFSTLRDRFATAAFDTWPAPYNQYSLALESEWRSEHAHQVGFYYFVQFHADKQLRNARNHARAAGVVFKGDLPIGVSRHSVEVWTDPHLFCLDGQAGSPPDAFATDGQNWGFPTYNWPEMAKDGYGWWRRRFEQMADYFDAYRIDHILGFFRIWEIPVPQKSGLLGHFSPALPFSVDELAQWGFVLDETKHLGAGADTLFVRDHTHPNLFHPRIEAQDTARYEALTPYEQDRFNALYTHYFYHRHNDFWAAEALAKLPPLIEATRMLCCAEDLGMIPACVGPVLDQLQVATLEIERMPKEPHCEFARVEHYPWRSVATTSSHDITPLRAWWEEDRGATQRYYNQILGQEGVAPIEATPDICRTVVERHLACPSVLVILPIQDWLAIDGTLRWADPFAERINVPANANHRWCYRLHLSVETLNQAQSFNQTLAQLIHHAKRS